MLLYVIFNFFHVALDICGVLSSHPSFPSKWLVLIFPKLRFLLDTMKMLEQRHMLFLGGGSSTAATAERVSQIDHRGWSPLHVAAFYVCLGVVVSGNIHEYVRATWVVLAFLCKRTRVLILKPTMGI